MKTDQRQKCLKAIKKKYVLIPTKCEVCQEEYVYEKMWTTKVFAPIPFWETVQRFYCSKCCATAKAVLDIAQTLEDKKNELPPIYE